MTLRKKRVWLGFYLLLLMVSHEVRSRYQQDDHLAPEQKSITVKERKGPTVFDRDITLAYHHHTPQKISGIPVLLIHGSPMASASFNTLKKKLIEHHELIIPDLPGVGGSTWKIKNYSIETHAHYLKEFVEQLGLESFHLVAYSQGGGVGIHLLEQTPERITSYCHFSAIGVQEIELLGDYILNHGLYLLQLIPLWAIQEAIPHFGLLDNTLLSTSYARNFYDSDQRPLRDLIKKIQTPTLIVHGKQDMLLPYAAAKEHYRLIPQSQLYTKESGHGILFNPDDELINELTTFWAQAEEGVLATREHASPQRKMASSQAFDLRNIPKATGSMLIIVVILLGLSTLISEDLTCIGAGLMVANGNIPFFYATLGCYLGIVFSDSMLFLAGRYVGQPLIKMRPFRWMIKEQDLARCKGWFEKYGPITILGTRFIPGSRVPAYTSAGIVGMKLKNFLLWFFIGASVWTPLLVFISYVFGQRSIEWFSTYTENAIWVFITFIGGFFLLTKFIIPVLTWRGRRLFLAKWRRFSRFEFWPHYRFYPPVYAYILLLGIKYKGLSTLTAANPGIPDGGFIGESKSDILRNIKHPAVANFICVTQDYATQAEAFMTHNNYTYPIVLKPNEGQRGEGVSIIHTREELYQRGKTIEGQWIIQEYISGVEFGVFYYRYPEEQKGHIFSITDKQFTSVIGDGISTLERLILKDPRAVCQAEIHLNAQRKNLYSIPPSGAEIQLVEIGTHCRGSLFKDGNHLHTEKLLNRIDEIAQSFEGFYIGRFDIRCPSAESLSEGMGIRVMELNGVTSESTDMYDPNNTLLAAYKKLFHQLRITYAIGAINKKAGHPVTPFWKILQNGLAFEAKD